MANLFEIPGLRNFEKAAIKVPFLDVCASCGAGIRKDTWVGRKRKRPKRAPKFTIKTGVFE